MLLKERRGSIGFRGLGEGVVGAGSLRPSWLDKPQGCSIRSCVYVAFAFCMYIYMCMYIYVYMYR